MIRPAATTIPAASGAALVSGYYGTTTASPQLPTSTFASPATASSSTTYIGAIVGGTIGGLVAIVVIIAGALILFRRNRALTRHSHGVVTELPTDNEIVELPTVRGIAELCGKSAVSIAELSIESPRSELQGEKI
jgi:hypothetical protein